jgi:dTDP-L-rhamnose 4-epimerase
LNVKILITGGAGFIGRHLAAKLAAQGAEITVLDALKSQIHGAAPGFPAELKELRGCVCVRGDVCDRELVASLLAEAEAVVHLAAETGTGQSMYEILRYERTNVQGTATLLDVIVNERPKSLRKLIVSSSRAVYGEGSYHCPAHGLVHPRPRTAERMTRGMFETQCPICGEDVQPVPTSEDAPMAVSSFYGLTKQVQEQMLVMFAGVLGIDCVALRYQNVYGPGQSLTNPYTGLLAVFAGRARQGKTLAVFEDGLESRDFIYIDDVVAATALCLGGEVQGVHVLNVGSGVRTSIIEVARMINRYFGGSLEIAITGDFRVGDIRHNVADISRLRDLTGYGPKWSFADGLRRFLDWASAIPADFGDLEGSLQELRARGMLSGSQKC